MSNSVYHRYALDPTGVNPDNFVSEEPHMLSNREFRFIVPKHAPFYAESVVVYDGVTLQPISKGIQYVIPTISQEATLRFGKEIADSILILDRNVASTVYVSYQALGGLYQNNIDNTVNIYEAFMNDNRMVDWMTGVYGKPSTYPPSPHAHRFDDLFGFEVLSFALERIRQAILMGYTPAFDLIFKAIMEKMAKKQDIDQGLVNDKIIPLDVLQHAAQLYNFNTIEMMPKTAAIRNGKTVKLNFKFTNPPDNDAVFWKIEHIDSVPEDFVMTSGILEITNNEGIVEISASRTEVSRPLKQFRITLHRGGLDRLQIFKSQIMTLRKAGGGNKDSIITALRVPCLNSPQLDVTAKSHAVNRRLWNAKQS